MLFVTVTRFLTDFFVHGYNTRTLAFGAKSFVHLFKGGRFPKGKALWSSPAGGEIPFTKNGEWGEKSDSFSRGGEHDRRPFVRFANYLFSKTFQWNVFDRISFLDNAHVL